MFYYEIYRECYDPIQEAIDLQLGNRAFNEYPSIETIIVSAIDEKYSRLPNKYKRLVSLKLQGLTNKEIAETTGYSVRYVEGMWKRRRIFTHFDTL